MALTSACGRDTEVGGGSPSAAAGPTGTWAGRVEGTDAFVAVVGDGEQVAAYVCESGTIAEWFFGSESGADLALTSSGGAKLTLSLGGDATGQVTLANGTSHAFRAAATDATALYRADGETPDGRMIGGWIQLGNETRGSVSVVSTGGIVLQPAVPIDLSGSPTLTILFPSPMTPSTLGQPTANTTRFVWGAMGDSYASGEGNPETGIADPSNHDDFTGLRWGNDASIWIPIANASQAADLVTCHRSDQAGAPKAHRRLQALYSGVGFTLGFTACSGAATTDLINDGYAGPGTLTESLQGHARVPQPAQISRIRTLKEQNAGQLDALYMSIGGNDVGFGDIIGDCVFPFDATPGGCASKWTPLFHGKLDDLAASYATLDQVIKNRLGNVPVLHSDYPNPLHNGAAHQNPPVCQGDDFLAHGETGIGAADDFLKNNLSVEEAVFAFSLADAMNSVIRRPSAPNWAIVPAPAFAGNGLCTGTPHFNLNSAGLHRQGHDLDKPVFVLSAGLLHPNDAGFEAYADVIVASLRPLVDARVRTGLAAPTGVRIASAVRSGDITLQWNDRATSENAYQIEVKPARPEDADAILFPTGAIHLAGGGFAITVPGTNKQQFRHVVAPQPAMFTYRVRACHTGIGAGATCGSFSPEVVGANFAPTTPTGLAMSSTPLTLTQRLTSIAWAAAPGAIEYVLRMPADSAGQEVRTSGNSYFVAGPGAPASVQVAACNRVGCSAYSTGVP